MLGLVVSPVLGKMLCTGLPDSWCGGVYFLILYLAILSVSDVEHKVSPRYCAANSVSVSFISWNVNVRSMLVITSSGEPPHL